MIFPGLPQVSVILNQLASTGASAMVIFRVADPVPVTLDADIVTLDVPAVVGVPEITPVVLFTLRPAGKPVALYEVGEFEAAIP